MNKEGIKTVQDISLEILLKIKEICEANNIEFFLLYGTLLGAIRHDGFIPWDDDIDIGMTRENYLKFAQIAQKELSPNYKMFVMGSGSTKYMSELKIGKRGTKYCPEDAKDLNIMDEIAVDIFMVDKLRNLSPKCRKLANRIRRFLTIVKLNWDEKKLLITRAKKSKPKTKYIYAMVLFALHALRAIVTEYGLEYIIYKIYVSKDDSSAKNQGVMTGDTKVRFWPPEFQIVEHKFEQYSMPIPACYDKMLTESYHNYMQLPPEDKRYRKDMSDWILIVNDNE